MLSVSPVIAPAVAAAKTAAPAAAAATWALPGVSDLITNLGVFSLALTATVAGIYRAVRMVRKEDAIKVAAPVESPIRIAGATILENTTILLWSESNRGVAESNKGVVEKMDDLEREVVELRHAISRLTDTMRESHDRRR